MTGLDSTPSEAMYGMRFGSALAFATEKHHGQRRKGSGAPYVTHPLAVASIVGQYGGDEDQAIAALLHDVMEDCGVTRDDLATRFGERVARIVVACTDTVEQPKPPWRARKEAHIAKVRSQDGDTKLVIAADKLHNATCIVRDARRRSVGEAVWSRFTADRQQVLWYYRSMAEALREGWEHELAEELVLVVAQLG
jgi:(p)ppGpp synthase/HD superfamily hydrolase